MAFSCNRNSKVKLNCKQSFKNNMYICKNYFKQRKSNLSCVFRLLFTIKSTDSRETNNFDQEKELNNNFKHPNMYFLHCRMGQVRIKDKI